MYSFFPPSNSSATLFTSLLRVKPNVSAISIKVNSNAASPPHWLRTVVVHSFLKGDIIKLLEALNFWLQEVWQLALLSFCFISVSCIFSLFPFSLSVSVFLACVPHYFKGLFRLEWDVGVLSALISLQWVWLFTEEISPPVKGSFFLLTLQVWLLGNAIRDSSHRTQSANCVAWFMRNRNDVSFLSTAITFS